ncbi:permease [Alkalibacter rhizosphaerae]|uniref:Permease n=1 Tax=Alkalibacter rhizosphaerae TaxID=2815577 RepID=A0A975AID9_9FIRM|nr:permease [Alkalibacter rhizosphaerae]QSX09367.1 permease [Alkalibacter rhizosphaerae]
MQTAMFYLLAIGLLILSYSKDKMKTKKSVMKAVKSIENMMPQFIGIIILVGVMLAVIDPQTISRFIGSGSGWLGVALAAIVGGITLIPGFIAFPTAALLLHGGAGYMQVGAFVSSLMMVGVVTVPLETKFFGKKVTFKRNILAFLYAFVVAFIIGKVMGEI